MSSGSHHENATDALLYGHRVCAVCACLLLLPSSFNYSVALFVGMVRLRPDSARQSCA
jgi:hypothetical protein